MQDTIGDISNRICDQIISKMKHLGIIVKEPLLRRASFDDWNMCFENANKKQGNNSVLGSVFGYSIGNNYCAFTNNHNLRNLTNSTDLEDSDQSQQTSRSSSQTKLNSARQPHQKANSKLCKGLGLSQSGSMGLNNYVHRQKQEAHLDDGVVYEIIRKDARRSTWSDIKSQRKKLQRFIHRQAEYKKIFDLIMKSYDKFKECIH